jgi:hypothetical protein
MRENLKSGSVRGLIVTSEPILQQKVDYEPYLTAIERIMEIHRDTISDVIEDLARHARDVTDFLIKNVGLTKVQVDELWSFVKKNKRTLMREMLMQIDMPIAGYT